MVRELKEMIESGDFKPVGRQAGSVRQIVEALSTPKLARRSAISS
jgi:hypothetical protein